MRVGHGWDRHRLAQGRPFRMGGLTIPFDHGPVGHSDGDCALHALADAILGAAALGDIGLLFPDSDARWKGADSTEFIEEILRRVHTAGFRVGNADLTIITEAPKIGPYREALRQRIGQLLEIHPSHVSIKAKTGEGVDAVGRREAVECHAVVLREEVPTTFD
jgi:2-C-methyl-D-erythritol 2,4-cyclodiphosphate synthase